MTLEQLTKCNADELEKLTDAQLLEHFKPFFNVTRPEFAQKQKKQEQPTMYLSPQKQAMLRLLADEGVDIKAIVTNKRNRK